MLRLYSFLFCVLILTIAIGTFSRVALASDENNDSLEVVKDFSLVSILSASSALLMWQEILPESVHVPLTGFKVQTWAGNDNDYKEIIVKPDVSKVLVNTLKPNSINFARIVPFNTQGNGPPTNTISIQTPEGVPGPVQSLVSFPLGLNDVMLQWKPPLESNGKLQGYKIYCLDEWFHRRGYGQIEDGLQTVDSDSEQAKVSGLKANTQYHFNVVGFTAQGNGEHSYIDRRTLKSEESVAPTTPGLSIKCISSDSEYAKAKITWHPDFAGKPGTKFYVTYHKVGETSSLRTDTEWHTDYILLNELEPNQQFDFTIVAVNGDYETSSHLQRYISSYQC